MFAAGGLDQKVYVYDETTRSLITELKVGSKKFPGHSNRIFAIKFHPHISKCIISSGWDNTI